MRYWMSCVSVKYNNKTRNSAVDDKPRDEFVQMQWRGWPPQNTPLPYTVRVTAKKVSYPVVYVQYVYIASRNSTRFNV